MNCELFLSYLSGIDAHKSWLKTLEKKRKTLNLFLKQIFIIHSYSLAWILLMVWRILGYKGKFLSLTLLMYSSLCLTGYLLSEDILVAKLYLRSLAGKIVQHFLRKKSCPETKWPVQFAFLCMLLVTVKCTSYAETVVHSTYTHKLTQFICWLKCFWVF